MEGNMNIKIGKRKKYWPLAYTHKKRFKDKLEKIYFKCTKICFPLWNEDES